MKTKDIMGTKPCEFCGGKADTFGVYTSCSKCRDEGMKLLKRRLSARRRRGSFGRKRRFAFENRSN